MEHLLKSWDLFKDECRRKTLLLFLDYDGTLTPIQEHPNLACLSAERKKILRRLARRPNCRVAIISGRSIKELKRVIGLRKKITYIGNHGLEFQDLRLTHLHPGAAAFKRLLRKLIPLLGQALGGYPEVWIEDKNYTLSIHYRKLPESKVETAREMLYRAVRPYLVNHALILRNGKKVWEIRPPFQWDKGAMVLWTLARTNFQLQKKVFPIYIGDDETDEDGLKAVKKYGLGIKVTSHPRRPSYASFYLRSPSEVYTFLQRILLDQNIPL